MKRWETWVSSTGISVGAAIIIIGGIACVRMLSDIRTLRAQAFETTAQAEHIRARPAPATMAASQDTALASEDPAVPAED